MVIIQTCLALIKDLFAEHRLNEENNSDVIMTKLFWVGRTWERHV